MVRTPGVGLAAVQADPGRAGEELLRAAKSATTLPNQLQERLLDILFVMDPPETMHPEKDTSFAFMRGAQARGHRCYHCLVHHVYCDGGAVRAVARPIAVSAAAPHHSLGAPVDSALADFAAVFIRKDPPFDRAYSHLTRLLDLARGQTLVINDPQGIRDANEKLFAFRFARFMPQTLVTADPEHIQQFVERVGGRAILKPLDGAGGSGVVVIGRGDPNTRALVGLLTRDGRRLAMVQEFLPDIRNGDKRVLVLDGEVLGAILRVPRSDDVRANIHVGGEVRPTDLSDTELTMIAEVGAELRRSGLWFVGLDLIAGRLIEVNVTSPTGLQELGRHHAKAFEEEVIAWVEARVHATHC